MSLLDKAKDAAGKAAEKAKHATAVGKEKIEDVRLQKKIEALHEEIGKLIVSQRRDQAPVDVDSQIDAKIREIGDIEQQIEANSAGSGSGDGTPEASA